MRGTAPNPTGDLLDADPLLTHDEDTSFDRPEVLILL
jgi:hypothetical protein